MERDIERDSAGVERESDSPERDAPNPEAESEHDPVADETVPDELDKTLADSFPASDPPTQP